MRQPKEGAGEKLKEQQHGDRALHSDCGGAVCVLSPNQRCNAVTWAKNA